MYVLGHATPEEVALVERETALHEEVRKEIEAISVSLEKYAKSNAAAPDPTVKPFLMATIDYMERLKAGEVPGNPPELQMNSTAADYAQWLEREDLKLNEPLTDVKANIIGYTPTVLTAIVWLTAGAPPETHTDELEKFLILEGTCDITIGDHIHSMKPGDVLFIPLHVSHNIRVTSNHPCKVILQRIAA